MTSTLWHRPRPAAVVHGEANQVARGPHLLAGGGILPAEGLGPDSVLHSDPCNDTAELVGVLVRRLSDPSLLRDQGRAARALTERGLDGRQTWQGLAAVYTRVIGRAP